MFLIIRNGQAVDRIFCFYSITIPYIWKPWILGSVGVLPGAGERQSECGPESVGVWYWEIRAAFDWHKLVPGTIYWRYQGGVVMGLEAGYGWCEIS